MVTSMQRPTEPKISSTWKMWTAVLAVVAIGLLIWALSLQSTIDKMHKSMQPGSNSAHGAMSDTGQPMSSDLGPADAQYDLRFIDAMIPHHESAVDMGQDALSKSKRPEIRQLAREIINAQTREIKQLQDWRNRWY